ncbi:MAG: tRNA pseudouridine(38-40) synthase TruA [Candidatus Eisenbacteria bacterium]|nr:tRNA pseudouridine(38-40) synthase TruA [Candidatus Eisenbacteria bacterium]
MTRRTLRMVVEFDGVNFHGWQRQSGVRTVQGDIESTLQFVLQHRVRLTGVGRTDSGCHALAHAASFHTSRPLPATQLKAALNSLLGRDIRVHALEDAPPGFNARWSARWRDYSYALVREPSALLRNRAHRPFVWPKLEALAAAIRPLTGEIDAGGLANRSPDNKQPLCRILRIGWQEWSGGLIFRIRADHFLYRMVRTIVGTCLEIGQERWPPDRIMEILDTGDRRLAGPPAPPDGLYFSGAGYEPLWPAAAGPPVTPWWGATRDLSFVDDEQTGDTRSKSNGKAHDAEDDGESPVEGRSRNGAEGAAAPSVISRRGTTKP